MGTAVDLTNGYFRPTADRTCSNPLLRLALNIRQAKRHAALLADCVSCNAPLPYEALRLVQHCRNQLIFFWSEAPAILPKGYKGRTQ
jgi:hypothetical protein